MNAGYAHLYLLNLLRGGDLARLFSTHPPLEERILRLRSMRHRSATGVGRRPDGRPMRA